MEHVVVNAIGEQCPMPVVKADQAMKKLAGPGVVEVLVDNVTAVENLKRLAAQKNCSVEVAQKSEKEYSVSIGVETVVEAAKAAAAAVAPATGNLVVAVGSATMGEGSDELGKTLMKGFLFAVSQLEELPKTILFYNGGAQIPVEGSDSLEDLKNMATQGVEILTCGTCLNYYGLSEKLAVGSVTNMYSIVEKLSGASSIIKP